MNISSETLTFYYQQETRQLLITYPLYETRNLRVLLFEYPYKWQANYQIYENGEYGRMLIDLTSVTNEDPDNYFTGKLNISLSGDNNFSKFYEIPITQYCSNSLNQYIKTSKRLVVLPSWYSLTEITFEGIGGDTLADVVSDNTSIVPSFSGNVITLASGINNEEGAFYGDVRNGKITLKNNRGSGEIIEWYQFNTVQSPIWSDKNCAISTTKDWVEFSIYTNGYLVPEQEPIYTGRAYKLPGEQMAKISINRICESFLENHMNPAYNVPAEEQQYARPFYLKIGDTFKDCYVFSNDWEYRYSINLTRKSCNVIDGPQFQEWIDPNMPLFFTIFNNNFYDDSSFTPIQYTRDEGDSKTWITVADACKYSYMPFETKVVRYNAAYLPEGAKELRVGNRYFKICPYATDPWVIYFKGKTGGYSWIIVKGKILKTNDNKAYETTSSIDNNLPEFERNKYMNEITTLYTCNIPLLSKEQANIMDELVESTEVYLYHVGDADFIPVLVENKNVDFKQNVNVRNYQIQLRTAQTRLRK